ncbi:U1 small nuclear ribonucleoprotein [Choanephora cucurbitarum]|uniref:U1 small nuclear ribonucleoprotein 70 kDa n=1 Tax=Choanephora cucurbitarum TaxID=101091 RepID=A0A1C7N2B0_9FUNG|nr:U1 small nuclear ribonucleoprotein [Choanephora cucurbitarum]
MTDKLPPNLLKLFAPRPPLPYLPQLDKDPEKRVGCIVDGIASYVDQLRNYDPDYVPWKTLEEKRKEKAEAKRKQAEANLKEKLAEYDPEKDPNIDGDPFNTLFVTHLSPELTESDLAREFELYGQIKKIRLVRDQEGKSRCYAFIEFEREKDMRAAYKDADGLKILGRRILVDVERARTVKGWKPRRLGGGLGGREQQKKSSAIQHHPTSQSRDRYHDRDRGHRGYGYNRRDDDNRKRSRMRSRSRSPRGYNSSRYGNGGGGGGGGGGRRDRSRDRMGRRDRY